jgi:hypothetical protein
MTNKDIQPEIEALHMEIKDLKKSLRLTIETLSDAIYALRGFREQRLLDADRITR